MQSNMNIICRMCVGNEVKHILQSTDIKSVHAVYFITLEWKYVL